MFYSKKLIISTYFEKQCEKKLCYESADYDIFIDHTFVVSEESISSSNIFAGNSSNCVLN